MNIVVMGTGGVGGYFGAKLANAGNNVCFIARGKHLEAIKNNGLKIISETGDILIHPANATDNPEELEIADIILFCVKPIVGPKTAVIPFLNGLGHIEIMKNILGNNNVIGGVAAISALIEEPGIIRHNSPMQMLKFGEFSNEKTERVIEFQSACEKAGINNAIPDNINTDMWQKIVMICTLAGANCITRLPLGKCRSNPATRTLMKNLAEEVVAVAKAENISLPDNQVEMTMKQLDSLPEGMKASTLPALEKGEKLEASALNGAIDKLGSKHNINTNMHKAVYAALAPHENGSQT